jgi:tetratricopeptide (TPR) repeat protein/DNA-binding CsgD family transcriptional regulator
MKIFFIIIILTLNVAFSQSENVIDSLEKELEKMPDDSNKVKVFIRLSKNYYRINRDSSMIYSKSGLGLSKKLNYTFGKAKNYDDIANLFTRMNLDSSLKFNKLAIDEYEKLGMYYNSLLLMTINAKIYINLGSFEEANQTEELILDKLDLIKDSTNKAKILLDLANFNRNKTEYEKSGDYYIKAQDIIDKLNNPKLKAQFDREFAFLKIRLGQLSQSIFYFNRSLEYFLETENDYMISSIYSGLGTSYLRMNNKDSAYIYLQKAKKINIKTKDYPALSSVLQNLSLINRDKGNFEDALKNLKEASALNKEMKHLLKLRTNYISISQCFMYLDKFDSSEYYYNLANEIESVDKKEILQNYILMYNINKSRNNEKALFWLEKAFDLKDSVNKSFSKKDLDMLESQLKVRQEKAVSAQKQKQARQKILFISLFSGLLLIFLIIIYRKNQTRKKLNKELEIKNEEIASKNNQLSDQNEELSILNDKIQQESSEKIKLQEELHNKEISQRDKELKNLSIEILDKNKAIEHLRANLDKECEAKPEIRAVMMKSLEDSLNLMDNQRNFDEYMKLIYKDFHANMLEKFPDLSPAELKICTLMKMNYDSKDIAAFLNRSHRTIETHRSNIRKKMNLGTEANLQKEILAI